MSSGLYMDPAGLSDLRMRAANSGSHRPDTETLRAVARQFEAVFARMLLKNMRAASLGDGLFDSNQGRFYRDMFDQQMASEMSRGQGLGLADILVRQLGGEQGAVARTRPSRVAATQWEPKTPSDFVRDLWPHAKRAASVLGVAPKFLLAQAALETGWGRHPVRHADGGSSHNLFNIKAGSGWDGERVTVPTLEFRDGLAQRETAVFRAYDSPEESFRDYVRLMQDSPRYREALQKGHDAPGFFGSLARAGYATDPDYAGKLMRIVGGGVLREALAGLKFD